MDIFKSWLVTQPIAHRGFWSADIPENSLAACEAAIQKGYVIEIDLRQLDDGTVVVFHDDSLSRMTGKDGYVSSLKKDDLADKILIGSEDNPQSIPTLEETLKLIDGRTPLLIEIKNSGKVGFFEQAVIDILATYKGEVAVQSFNPYCLKYFSDHAPYILRGQLSSYFKHVKEIGALKRAILKRMKLNNISKPDFIGYDVDYLPNKYVKKYVKKHNVPVIAWTIKSNAEMESALPHCENIIFERFEPKK
ncbi:MAG: glycerophosphodiester phosphodiesterase [Firmicutes bacterium]|nr:glycerophosphodiester phosphodiesterase [Bacillota bacterium]